MTRNFDFKDEKKANRFGDSDFREEFVRVFVERNAPSEDFAEGDMDPKFPRTLASYSSFLEMKRIRYFRGIILYFADQHQKFHRRQRHRSLGRRPMTILHLIRISSLASTNPRPPIRQERKRRQWRRRHLNDLHPLNATRNQKERKTRK